MQNSKKGIANIITSFLGQIITLALGIIIPRLVLVNLGSESNGLMTSINTVLTYVALLEAGVGTASLMALYTPVALDDKQRINYGFVLQTLGQMVFYCSSHDDCCIPTFNRVDLTHMADNGCNVP